MRKDVYKLFHMKIFKSKFENFHTTKARRMRVKYSCVFVSCEISITRLATFQKRSKCVEYVKWDDV